jgi:hypothetical protein
LKDFTFDYWRDSLDSNKLFLDEGYCISNNWEDYTYIPYSLRELSGEIFNEKLYNAKKNNSKKTSKNKTIDNDLKKNLVTKLVCTNEKRVRNIIGGLTIGQDVNFEYTKKGVSCFVDKLEYHKSKRNIIVDKKHFIGHIPFSKTSLIKNNKSNIRSIEIFDIKEKYKNQKAIIIKIEFLEGVKIDG